MGEGESRGLVSEECAAEVIRVAEFVRISSVRWPNAVQSDEILTSLLLTQGTAVFNRRQWTSQDLSTRSSNGGAYKAPVLGGFGDSKFKQVRQQTVACCFTTRPMGERSWSFVLRLVHRERRLESLLLNSSLSLGRKIWSAEACFRFRKLYVAQSDETFPPPRTLLELHRFECRRKRRQAAALQSVARLRFRLFQFGNRL